MYYLNRIAGLLLVLGLCSLKGVAQNQTTDTYEFKIKGKHDFYFHIPLNDNSAFRYPVNSPKMINQLSLNFTQKKVKVVSEWKFRTIQDTTGQQTLMTHLIPNENYIKYEGDKVHMAFGLQIYAWGVADRINPTNNLNPLDYTITGFEQEHIPVLSASMDYFPNDNWKIQGVYIPYEQSDAIFWSYAKEIPPDLFSKYIISDFEFTTRTAIPAFMPQEKVVRELPIEYNINSGVYGAKLNFYSSTVDFSLSYVYDFDPYYTPVISMEHYVPGITSELEDKINQSLPAENAALLISELSNTASYRISTIDLVRKRIHRIGGDIKTIIGRFGVWLEACYSLTEHQSSKDYQNRGSDLFFVLGTDFFFGPNDRFYANVQYSGKWIPDFYHSFYSDYPGGLPKPGYQQDKQYMQNYYYQALVQPLGFQSETYQHGVAANLNFSFLNGKMKPSLVAYLLIPEHYDKAEKSRYSSVALIPSVDYTPGNSLHFELGAYLAYSAYKNVGSDDFKYNDKSSIIGLLNPYNNVYVKVTYSWNNGK